MHYGDRNGLFLCQLWTFFLQFDFNSNCAAINFSVEGPPFRCRLSVCNPLLELYIHTNWRLMNFAVDSAVTAANLPRKRSHYPDFEDWCNLPENKTILVISHNLDLLITHQQILDFCNDVCNPGIICARLTPPKLWKPIVNHSYGRIRFNSLLNEVLVILLRRFVFHKVSFINT